MPRSRTASTEIAIKNRAAELRRLLWTVDEFCAAHTVPHTVRYCARLAVEEIVTNLLKYARPPRRDYAILVRLAVQSCTLTLRIQDDAPPFNPLRQVQAGMPKALQDKARGGYGLLLVSRVMDEFKYRRARGQNIITLRKKLD